MYGNLVGDDIYNSTLHMLFMIMIDLHIVLHLTLMPSVRFSYPGIYFLSLCFREVFR